MNIITLNPSELPDQSPKEKTQYYFQYRSTNFEISPDGNRWRIYHISKFRNGKKRSEEVPNTNHYITYKSPKSAFNYLRIVFDHYKDAFEQYNDNRSSSYLINSHCKYIASLNKEQQHKVKERLKEKWDTEQSL